MQVLQDLYSRLAVIPVPLPPLRERLDDIPMLMRHVETELRARTDSPPPLSEEVVSGLAARSWPGNVRELRNGVARALSLGGAGKAGGLAAPAVVGAAVDLDEPLLAGRERVADAYERAYIEAALQQTGGNVSRAGTSRR